MSRRRILYVDVPFEHEPGGDKHRSRFLWQTLCRAFDPDLLLITSGAPTAGRPAFTEFTPALTLTPVRGPWHQSASVFAFAPTSLEAFNDLLARRRFDAVVARFHSPWALAIAAAAHPTRPAVIVDLDMLSSRLVGLTWRQAPSWRNRWFLFERLKLERLERRLFQQAFLILFSNPVELAEVRARAQASRAAARLAVWPNVMPGTSSSAELPPQSHVLFFGSLNSGANTDAFRFLVEALLPRIEADLCRHCVTIRVVGKNPPAWFADLLAQSRSDRVQLVGAVDSMERAIAESRFVLLPLRVASGTRTRILEAAAQGRAVVTTSLGAEGIDVGEGALIADDPDGLAAGVRRLLDHPDEAKQLGRRLRETCLARYAPDRVAGDLVAEIERFIAARAPASP